jgi:tRNA(fMet)-specific endonuclease VapC
MKNEPAFDEVLAHGKAVRQADRQASRGTKPMSYLLDTDHISILQKQSGPEFTALMNRISKVNRSALAFCLVSFHEQILGCQTYLAKARTAADVIRGYGMLDRVLDAFSSAPVLPFDKQLR